MDRTDKLIIGALVLAFAAVLGALMAWQDRRMDETFASYRACIADERADGLSWGAAREACIAQNR
jgi:hypothetical protein